MVIKLENFSMVPKNQNSDTLNLRGEQAAPRGVGQDLHLYSPANTRN